MQFPIWALAVNASGYIFAASGALVTRSADNGETWTWTSLTLVDLYSLAVNASGHIFAATANRGVFLSTDNGNTWREVNTGLRSIDVRSLALNSTGHIYAGTFGGGVYRSSESTTSGASAGGPLVEAVTNKQRR